MKQQHQEFWQDWRTIQLVVSGLVTAVIGVATLYPQGAQGAGGGRAHARQGQKAKGQIAYG